MNAKNLGIGCLVVIVVFACAVLTLSWVGAGNLNTVDDGVRTIIDLGNQTIDQTAETPAPDSSVEEINEIEESSSNDNPEFDSQIDPDWTTGWNIPYEDKGEWRGQYTFTGPAVIEWWDQQGNGYIHEGFVILMTGESVTFPATLNGVVYIGHWWKLTNDSDAGRLMTNYRHLVFYGNTKTMDELRTIFGQETYGRFYGDTVVPYKPQHVYMREYDCNFWDQSECAQLDQKVRHLPVGITIDVN